MGDAWSAPSPDAPDSALAGLPAEASGLALRRVASLHCLSLRHLPGGDGAARQALAEVGLPGWPAPGDIAGTGPWLVWRSPGESVVIATDRAAVDGILSRLQPGAQALACAVDLSDGRVALEVQGAPARIQRAGRQRRDVPANVRAPARRTSDTLDSKASHP